VFKKIRMIINYCDLKGLTLIKINFSRLLILALTLGIIGCSEKSFDPPNKQNIDTGSAENIVPVGTAIKLKDDADKMAKIWAEDAVLTSINGVTLGVDGFNLNNPDSKWIYTYNSAKKGATMNEYTIVFNGKGTTTWLASNANGKHNMVEDFTVDSSKALVTAFKNGLREGTMYTMELNNDGKNLKWTVGSKDKGSDKYELKVIDAKTGDMIK
jgi:hypothetical protein